MVPVRPLRAVQKEALAFSESIPNCAFFMEMRLGKSLVAIRHVLRLQPAPEDKMLIIAPKSTLEGWQEELALEKQTSTVLRAPFSNRMLSLENETKWFITNPESLFVYGGGASPIALLPWFSCVFDESDLIRNPKAKLTKICLRVLKGNSRFRVVLSGLPNPESMLDFYCQCSFLTNKFYGCKSWWEFRERTHKPVSTWDWQPKTGAIKAVREQMKTFVFFKTRKDAGVGESKSYETFRVDLPPKTRKAYDLAESDFELGSKDTKYVVEKRTWLCRMAGGQLILYPEYGHDAKLELVLALFKRGALLHGEKVVIWFRFNEELKLVSRELQRSEINCYGITGETLPQKRTEYIDQLNRGCLQVLCIQIKCGRYGLNMAGADTAIFYSNTEGWKDRAQCEDRIVSVDKKTPLLILDLVARNTVDEDILDTLKMKGFTAKNFNSHVLERMRKRLQERKATLCQNRKV